LLYRVTHTVNAFGNAGLGLVMTDER
jgi:hypothetical protein